ncbi:MAG: YbjQ family protein [Gammaproteobacteria bacterium]
MLVVTTFEVEGYRIADYKGVVRGLIVRSPTIIQGFFASFKNIIGGHIGSYSEMCETAREQAYELMVHHATQMGANAVIGMRYDAAEVSGRFSATEVLCYGTAVVLAKKVE